MAQIYSDSDEDFDSLEEFNTLQFKYLVFSLGNEEYALAARYVSEIVGMQHITVVPNLDRHVRGVINLRGKVIPVVDTRLRFGLEAREYDDRTCIILTQDDEYGMTGLIVDAVVEVADIHEEQISPPPKTIKGSRSRYIQGMARQTENVRMILDLRSILDDENIALLQGAGNEALVPSA
jgi:purine-binding chemotaxis protein CheW